MRRSVPRDATLRRILLPRRHLRESGRDGAEESEPGARQRLRPDLRQQGVGASQAGYVLPRTFSGHEMYV